MADDLEVCPSCGGMMREGRYMCKDCRRYSNEPMVLALDKPEFMPKRYNKKYVADSICGNCSMLESCGKRVANGMWCCCEIPSTDDVLIVELGEKHGAF